MVHGAIDQVPAGGSPGVEEEKAVQLRPPGRRPPASDAERRALASVLRLRILRMCLYEPLTNKEIADRLRRDPATVLHHVRTLLTHRFLVAGDVRIGPRGSREVPYRATGRSWQLDFGDPGTENQSPTAPPFANTMRRAFVEEVDEVPEGSVRTTRLGLRLSQDHHQELLERISDLLNEFAGRPHDPEGRRWSLFVAIHPEPGGESGPEEWRGLPVGAPEEGKHCGSWGVGKVGGPAMGPSGTLGGI